jgi:hypothetical protein
MLTHPAFQFCVQTTLNSILQDTKNSTIKASIHITQFLLSHDLFDPSVCDNLPVKWASENGHVEVVRLLLSDNHVNPSDDNYAITWASALIPFIRTF